MNIVIDMNGSPASTVGTNETFLHFYQGTPTQSFSGYQASFQTLWLDKSGASITSIYDLFDTNSDSLADNYTETYTRSGVVWKNSGTITWDANGMFHAQQTAGDMASTIEGYGRLAFDAGGEAVGIYTFSPTASALPVGFGKVATDFGGGQDFGFSVATQSDGKILVAGISLNGGNFDFVLARFSADGILDTAFGGGKGKVTTDFGYSDAGLSVAVQSDGKILVGGQSWDIGSTNSNFKFTIARYNPDGSLDISFDGDGKVISSFGCGQSLIVQPDGKILMLGNVDTTATSSNMALLRYNIDGSLDTSFNGNGEVITTIGGSGQGVTLLPSGKILVAGSSWNNGNEDVVLAQYNANGTLNTSFNGGTIVTTDFGGDDQVSDVVLQSDGKILVTGYSLNRTNNISIARYNTDGSLDTTFSGDGKIMVDYGGNEQGYAVTVDPDGKILVSGHSDSNIVLLRYNADGTPDTTFSGDGLVTTNIGGVTLLDGQAFTGTDVTLQTDGKILVSGQSNGDVALVRYNSDGSLDTTFGLSSNTAPVFSDSPAGTVTTDVGGDDIGRSMTVQPDGKIVVAGLGNALGGFLLRPTVVISNVTYNAANISYLIGDFALARYNADGTLDTTFHGDGTLTTYFGGNNLSPTGVIVQLDGRILVAGSGYNRNSGTNDFALARYNSDGSLDTTFSGNGKVLTDFASGYDTGNSIKIQSDGKILVVGTSGMVVSGGTSNNDFALVRFNADGSFDTSFDGDGKLTTDFGGNGMSDFGTSVTVQADGKILVGGYAGTSFTYGYSSTGTPLTTTNNNFALARYNADGRLDTSFDGDGKLTTDFGGNETGQSVIVQSDGKILVVGSSSLFFTDNNTLTTLNSDFAIVRYNADGTLDTSFHGDGKLTTDFGGSSDTARSALLQSDGKILVAGNSAKAGGNADFALARYNVDGNLDTTFHGDGMFTMDFGGAADIIYSISVQTDGKILVGGASTIDGSGDFALARLNTDGSLDTTFGASGVHQTLYTATGTPVLLDNSLRISDAELATIGNYAGATLTLMRHGGANADDHFSAMEGQSLGALTQGVALVERGITVGSVTTNSGGTLALTFNANATPTLVNAVVQQIAYNNGSGTPPSSLQVDWSFSDGNTGSQGSGSAMSATTSTTVQIMPFIAPPEQVTNTAPTFAGYATGKVTTDFGKEDSGRGIAVQADGKVLVAGLGSAISGYLTSGGTTNITYTIGDHAIARYNSDGSLDTTFGVNGKVTTYFGGNGDMATGVMVQTDGKILVAGSGYDRGGSNTNDFSLARYNSDGSLDATFAGNGKVLTDFSAHKDLGQSIFLQADGRILVAGTSSTVTGVTPSASDIALVRYNADGSLDTTFGGSGKIVTDFGSKITPDFTSTDAAYSVTVQSDGKIIVVGSSSVVVNGISSIDFAFARYNADGSLESKETIDFDGNNIARSVAVQSDGKFLVVGDSTLSGNTDFRIARSNTAGNDLDAAFGMNGTITTDFGGNDYARSVILQSDGKILVAGNSTLATGVSDFALARYNTDGTLDTSFDGDGKLTMDFGGASDIAFSVKLQADGKILVAGSSSIDGNGDFALARLNADGSLDTTFGVVNTLNGHPVYTENGTPVVLDSDVQISDTQLAALGNYNGATLTLVRHSGASADDHFFAMASGTPGALTQGSDLVAGGVAVGTVTTNSGGILALAFNAGATQSLVNAVLQQIAYSNTSHVAADAVQIDWTFSDGNTGSQGTGGALSAVGSTTVHITALNDTPVSGVNTAPTFSVGDGAVITEFGKEDIGRSVAVQADGKILVAGLGNGISGYINASTGNMSYTIGDFGLARYNSDGSLDTTFGTDGKLTTYFGGNSDFATAVTVQSDGKILVSGTGYNKGSNDFALARYNSDGTLDTTFSGNGKVTTDFSSANDTVSGINVQEDGKILVVGTSGTVPGVTPSNSDFALARYNADGSLDTTFDGDGKLITDFGGSDSATTVSVQSDGKILVAGTSNVALNGVVSIPNFAFAGYNADGTLIGKTTLDFGGYDYCQSVTVQSDGKWILSGYSGVLVNGVVTNYNFALARYNADVTLDTTFNGDGMLTTDFGGNDYARSVIVQSDGKILVAGNSTVTGRASDFALARYNTDGTLDTTFDGDGKLTMDFGGASDTAFSITLQADGKILVAGSSSIDGNGNFALARLNADGSLDHTFGMVNNTLDARQVYIENGTPVVLDSNVHVSDTQLASLGNYNGATLTLLRHGAANAEDHFSGAGTLGDLTQGSNLVVDGTTVGTITTNSGGTLVLAFNAGATQNLVNAVLQQIAYSNTSHVTGATVQLDWSFSDGNTGTQGAGEALSTTGSTVVQIVSDTTAPTVIDFSPTDGVIGVAVGSDLVLTFSEPIQKGTGTIAIHSGSATGTVVESFDAATSSGIAISGNTLTINPTADLTGGKHYYVTFADGSIKDMAGNNFVSTSIYDFTTATMSTIALTPFRNPLDFFYISASQGGTLYDSDGNGAIDSMRVWGLGTSTGYYKIEWSDTTHWTAKGLFTYTFGTEYDIQGRPTTCIINGAELPVSWASTGNADHLLATVTRVNGTLSETWKVFDNNSDNQADAGIYTATTNGVATTTITTSLVALTQDSYGRSTSFISEVQTSTNPRDVFSGTVTGSSSDATAIQLPLGGSGTYKLIAAGTLVDSFTIYPSLIGRLYDMDGNSVIDQMDLVSTTAAQNGESATNIYSFALTWSDRTHWTAHAEVQMVFGTTVDASERPMTYMGVADGLVHDIVWRQNKGADNIVATSSYVGQNSGELVVVTFIDSLGDSNPDEIIYVKSNGSTEIERFQANIVGWTNNSAAVTVVIQTATDPTAVFSGSVTGSNIHAQEILTPLFTGTSGVSSHTLISTKHQVEVFTLSATDIGHLYDMDSNGIVDRMDIASTTTGQSGQTNTSIKSYALSWNDTAHWTAHAAYELLFGLQYDGQGRPTTMFMNGGEQTVNWATTVTNGVLATVSSDAAMLTLVDTNADSKPDAFDYTEGSGSTLYTAHGTLDWWVKDSSNHPVAVTAVMQTSSDPADSFSGSVTGSSSNATAIILPVMKSGETTGDRVSDNMLIFDLGIASPQLDAKSQMTVRDATYGGRIISVTLSAPSLFVDGSWLKVPLSGTDASGNPYSLWYSGGSMLLVDLPAGIAGQPDPIVKAWVVNSMNGTYSLSSMTVVGTTGTSGMDWVTGTSGNDSITADAGNDLIEWSGGNDTVDAGDGYDSVNLPLSSTNAFHWLDGKKVLHIGAAIDNYLDVYHITKNSDTSFRIDKLMSDGMTVESTMNLSNAESMGFGNQIHQFQVNYAGGQYVTGTPWNDQIFLNAANISNLIQVQGDFGHDTLVFNVGSGYSKLEMVKNGADLLLKGTLISDGSVVEFGHAVPLPNGNSVTMTLGAGVNAHSFPITDIEAFRFVSDAVTLDFAPDSLSSDLLSFDLGTQLPVLAESGHLSIVEADIFGYLKTVTLNVSQLVVVGSHLTIPMNGTDANGESYWLNPYNGGKLLVEIPAALLVGLAAQSHAWQVGNMSNTSMSLTPMNVVTVGAGTSGADWVTGTSGDDTINAGAGDDYIEWRGGHDVVDAGDGYDTLHLSTTGMGYSSVLDAEGVLHISAYTYPSLSGMAGESSALLSMVDIYRITKVGGASFKIDKMQGDGLAVDSTMLLSNAERVENGGSFRLNLVLHTFINESVGGGYSIDGTPWNDEISLDAANLGNLQSVWGDTGYDILTLNVGAGYSKLELVKSGQLYLLQGTSGANGAVAELGKVQFSSSYGGTMMTIGIGESAKSFSSYSIEAFHFVSGTTHYEVDPAQFAEVSFQGYSWQNSITGTAKNDTIDADALGLENLATTANDYIQGNGGNDTIDGGAGNDTASYQGNRADYTITSHDGIWTVADTRDGSPDGTDVLTGIEHLSFYDGGVDLTVQFSPASSSYAWSYNSITGTGFDDTIDADALAAANPWKGSQGAYVYFGSQSTYTLGANEFSTIGTVTFTAQELANLTSQGMELWHGAGKVESSFTVSAPDIINQTGGAYTLHWIGTAEQTTIPEWSIQFTYDKEGVYNHNDNINGNDGNDLINAGVGDDTIYGNGDNDTISGGAGNDMIDGGDGNDTAVFSGNYAEYTITHDAAFSSFTITDNVPGRDGTDVITSVENFQFADASTPFFTAFSGAVAVTSEEAVNVEVTFADLLEQGNEADAGGSIEAFVVKRVSNGSFKIGIDAASALAWNVSNNTIDALHHAYWTPAANLNGTLNAFAVVARDNIGLESFIPVQATVTVTPVPDAPVIFQPKSLSFASPVEYETQSSHYSVTSADFNGDGKADLIVANPYYYGSVSVLMNKGDGSFTDRVYYATGSYPYSVTSADVNGDGKADLIAANSNSNSVSVLINKGDGIFADKVDYATGSYPYSVTSADVNGDGKADLIAANSNSYSVSVLINKGDGIFADTVEYATGSYPYSVTSADVNGDGKADLIATNSNSNSVSVLINNGDGIFADKVDYASSVDPFSMTAADVNGDGKMDLIVTSPNNNNVSVLINKGDGTFAARIDYYTPNYPYSVTTADVNGDGKADLIFANINSSRITVWTNTTHPAETSFIEMSPVHISSDIIINDPDGDASWNGGRLSVQITANAEAADSLSLVTVNPGSNGIWLDTAGNKLMAVTTEIGIASAASVSNGDAWSFSFNANATNALVQDVARALVFSNSSYTPGTDDRSITFTVTDNTHASASLVETVMVTAVEWAPTLTSFSGSFGSINEDTGTAEVTFADLLAQGNEVDVDGTVETFVVKSVSNGTLRIGSDAASATPYDGWTNNTIDASHHAFWNPAANLNGTLNAFAVVAKDNSGVESSTPLQATVTVTSVPDAPIIFLPLALSLASHVDYNTGSYPFSVTSANVNGDGKADLIVANAGSNTVSVLMNKGDGTFADKVDYATGYNPYSVTSADINGDDKADLIVVNYSSSSVSVLINKGDGTFADKVDYATGYNPYSVTSADVNGDGKADLIVANSSLFGVSVLMNKGDGTFADRVDYAPYSSISVTSADLNGDGKADLIVANAGGSAVSVLMNKGDGTFADRVDYATGYDPYSVTSADVNGDGKADLIVANRHSYSVSVLMNNGDGTFATKVDYATGNAPISVTSADVNGDSKVDLIVTNLYDNSLSVLKNNGNGTFAAKVDYTTGSYPYSVTTADVNNDGKADLIVANENSSSVSVMTNTTHPARTSFFEKTPVHISRDIIINDPDGDSSWNGGSLKVQITANSEAADSLSLATTNPGGSGIWLDTAGNKLMAGSTEIGSADAASVSNGDSWHFSFNANATNTLVQDVARALIFSNSSYTPGTDDRSITFTVTDNTLASASLVETVQVLVGNLNDNAPVFTSGATGEVNENAATSTVIYTATTTDADHLAVPATYTLSGIDSDLLAINPATGAVTLKAAANYEDSTRPEHSYSFDVIAGDGAHTTTQAVVVLVNNMNDAPTGAVTITGTAQQDEILTASNTLVDEDSLGTISYQWKADGVTIAGAAGNTLLLGAAQSGKVITVQASYVDGHGTAESVSSTATAAVVGTQSGSVQDGYLSNALVWVDANGNGVRDWTDANSNGTWDSGEGESWALTDTTGQFTGLVGTGTIRITANPANPSGTIDISTGQAFTGSYSAPSGSTVVNPLTTLVVAAIAAGGTENTVKTALGLDASLNLSTYDPLAEAAKTGASSTSLATAIAVQSAATQVANIMEIAANVATGAGAVSTAGVAASVASALMTAAAGGTVNLTDSSVISGAITDAANNAGVTTTGLITVINSVSASSAAVNSQIADVSTAAQTEASAGRTVSAQNSMQQVVAAQIVAHDTVAVQAKTAATDNSSAGLTITSSSVGAAVTKAASQVQTIFTNHAPTGDVTMTGTATQGQTLTADNTLADIDGLGAISYQWYAGTDAISGATGGELLLGNAQVGKAISVKASYTDGASIHESVNSNTATILSQHLPTGGVTITGTVANGNTLTAGNTLADADGLGTISYQWYDNGQLISGANTYSWLVSNVHAGDALSVKASYTDGHGTDESVSSDALHQIAASSNDLKAELAAYISNFTTADNARAEAGIASYFSRLPAGGSVQVVSKDYSAQPAGSAFAITSSGHEALNIVLPNNASLTLDNAEFAIISGDNITVDGGAGNNMIYAGDGSQHIVLGVGDDTIHGGAGNDYVGSTTGNDWLYGDAGNDTLIGGAGDDHLYGGDGNDTLEGGGAGSRAGNDVIDGGAGDDTLVFSGNFAEYTVGYNSTTHEYIVTDHTVSRDGVDTVTNVEHFQFLDGTKEDIIDPVVASVSPINHATGVGVSDNIVLAFSEAIHAGTGTIAIHRDSATGTVLESYDMATSANLTITGNTLTINPTADLANGTHYFVTFENGNVHDLAGNNSAGANTYDFTTAVLPLHQDLTGSATFWKTGVPITGVTSTLTSVPAMSGTQLVEFRNIQLAEDGTRTLELWETSINPVESVQLEFTLSSGSVATWQDTVNLSPGWISMANTGISGQFILGSMGTTALSVGPVKLGNLTLTAPTNPKHFELLLTTGQLNTDTIPTFGIASDSTTTGSDGIYQHIDMLDGTYALTSAKVSGTAEANAIQANDALAALKMAVSMNPNTDGSSVSPYQFLAADINKDGVIRAADALNILKMAVKLDTAPANEWLFVPGSVGSENMSRTHVIWPDNPIPITLDVDQELHLIGIVKGDVDGSWVA